MFDYKVFTKEEAERGNLFKEGSYEFEVFDMVSTNKEGMPYKDKNGNPMLRAVLKVYTSEGANFVNDMLIFSDSMGWKVRKFFECIGLVEEYEQQRWSLPDILNRSGWADFGIEKGRNKDDGGNWPDKNVVKHYYHPSRFDEIKKVALVTPVKKDDLMDDDLPF